MGAIVVLVLHVVVLYAVAAGKLWDLGCLVLSGVL
jgi:hypothetical protein